MLSTAFGFLTFTGTALLLISVFSAWAVWGAKLRRFDWSVPEIHPAELERPVERGAGGEPGFCAMCDGKGDLGGDRSQPCPVCDGSGLVVTHPALRVWDLARMLTWIAVVGASW